MQRGMLMTVWQRTLVALVLIGFGLGAAAVRAETLVVGVAPHTSARVILGMYQPLRLALEKSLGQPVEIQTAPDFTEFARRAVQQGFDLAITTGHQARLLQTDAKYTPLVTYQADFKAVALVLKDSKYQSARDLDGVKAQGLSETSLVTLWGMHWLKKNKVKDYSLKYTSAADSVAQQLIAGESAVAFTSLANFQKLAPAVQAQLRILAESEVMAGRVYMLNARKKAQQARIEAALASFASSPEGEKYFAENKLGGYRPLRPKELNMMDPYAAEVRKTLAQPR